MNDQTRPDIENMPFSDLVELTCQLRARACNPQCSEQLHKFAFEVSNTLIKRIEKLEDTIAELESELVFIRTQRKNLRAALKGRNDGK